MKNKTVRLNVIDKEDLLATSIDIEAIDEELEDGEVERYEEQFEIKAEGMNLSIIVDLSMGETPLTIYDPDGIEAEFDNTRFEEGNTAITIIYEKENPKKGVWRLVGHIKNALSKCKIMVLSAAKNISEYLNRYLRENRGCLLCRFLLKYTPKFLLASFGIAIPDFDIYDEESLPILIRKLDDNFENLLEEERLSEWMRDILKSISEKLILKSILDRLREALINKIYDPFGWAADFICVELGICEQI